MAGESPQSPRSTQSERRFDQVEKQIQDLRVETRTEFTQLRGEMNDGFTQLRGEMKASADQLRAEMNDLRREMTVGFARVDERLDSMQRVMIQGFIAMSAAILAGFGGIVAAVAT